MESVVTFKCPHRTKAENENYANVRRQFMTTALRHRIFDLYEMMALGLSGTDIGDCVTSFMLVEAIHSNDSRFVSTALDNIMASEKTQKAHECACRALDSVLRKSGKGEVTIDRELQDRIRRWDV